MSSDYDPARRAPPNWMVAPVMNPPPAAPVLPPIIVAAPLPLVPISAPIVPPAAAPITERPRRSTALRVEGGDPNSSSEHRAWNVRAWD